VSIKLSALRPDLEFFRGTWLQNPENSDLQARIIFSNKTEIIIKFEYSGGPCPQEAWKQDSLQLENIDTAVEVLFYKHGSFYIRKFLCDPPEVLDKNSWIKILPIVPENDQKESMEIRYVTLKSLGKEIDFEVSKLDSEKNGMEGLILKSTKKNAVTVSLEDNQFSFDYKKGYRFVDVRMVRTIQYPPPSSSEDELYKGPEHFVDFAVTKDFHFIRYDRRLKTFVTPENEELDGRWIVRSNVGNTVLRVGSGNDFRTVCVPPRLCSVKSESNIPYQIKTVNSS